MEIYLRACELLGLRQDELMSPFAFLLVNYIK